MLETIPKQGLTAVFIDSCSQVCFGMISMQTKSDVGFAHSLSVDFCLLRPAREKQIHS
jgi:hypothetical protein